MSRINGLNTIELTMNRSVRLKKPRKIAGLFASKREI